MNAKTIVLIAAMAAAGNAFAERAGRDSVYAAPGSSVTTPSKTAAITSNGRDSVYAKDLSRRTTDTSKHADTGERPGRS